MWSNHCDLILLRSSRLQHLVALLPSLQTLYAPLVHLLFHLRESLALFLGCALGTDSIDSALYHNQSCISFHTHQINAPVARPPSLPSIPSPWPCWLRAFSSLLCAYPRLSDWLGAERRTYCRAIVCLWTCLSVCDTTTWAIMR